MQNIRVLLARIIIIVYIFSNINSPVVVFGENITLSDRALIIQSNSPWSSNANQIVLDNLDIPYTQIDIDQLANFDLREYRLIIISNDQDNAFYNRFRQNKLKLEDYIKNGGTMIFGASSGGWADGDISSALPGNITIYERRYENYNIISDSSHPIVTGELSDGQPLTDSDLYSNYASHTSFEEATLPSGSKVILREKSSGQPTLVEYSLGSGIVIVSGLTWEHSWKYHTGSDGYGTYARKALDDVFLYAYRYNEPPVVKIVLPINNQVFKESSNFAPTIKVSDTNGGTLVCKYYIDGQTSPSGTTQINNTRTEQTISFNLLNTDNLSEGEHIIKFEVSDSIETTVETVKIKIDRSLPVLGTINFTATDTSITVSGTATDSVAGMDSTPYRYTVGSYMSSWTANTSHIKSDLTSNTSYTVKFEAKDAVGHIANKVQNMYTRAQTPILTVSNPKETSFDINFTDSNPSGTQYQVIVGEKYVNASGTLTTSPTWISNAGKKITVKGLSINTAYIIKAKAKNQEGIETAFSANIAGQTLASPPTNITTEAAQQSITVMWSGVSGAAGYDIEADGVVINNGTFTTYIHEGLAPNTQHTYRVRTRNASGPGNWSNFVTKSTLPDPPAVPANLRISATQTEISITWDAVVAAAGYDIEVDGDVIDNGSSTSYVHKELQPLTEHTYRVRAKNPGGISAWSELTTTFTLPNPPVTPTNIAAQATKTTVTITWDSVDGATAYEIEVDGLIIDNDDLTAYLHEGLEPYSGHTYRVRAKNAGGKSPWSGKIDITTYPEEPDTPNSVMTTADETSITVTWYKVAFAESYEVEIDGNVVKAVSDTNYVHTDLTQNSQHSYRVRAKNISGYSEWSSPVSMFTMPEGAVSLTNIAAVVTNKTIMLSWETVAYEGEYEIEVDGVLMDNGKETIYNHTGLEANQYHTYKIRVKNGKTGESWCAILSLSTLPNPPDAPLNIEVFATHNTIELRWDRVEGATGYDVEADGETIDNGMKETYIHENLEPGTAHIYRVRAKNITGVTAWSPSITQSTTTPTYIVDCITDEDINFSLLASNVQDFSELKFVVTYNPSELEVVDLYGFTPEEDRSTEGIIPGTHMRAIYTEGRIEFTLDKNIIPGTSWSGEITSIIFRAKIDGQSQIDFVVE
ncbi:MAG: fibronectin type III domain-containing protein [Bacillota bacterium]